MLNFLLWQNDQRHHSIDANPKIEYLSSRLLYIVQIMEFINVLGEKSYCYYCIEVNMEYEKAVRRYIVYSLYKKLG